MNATNLITTEFSDWLHKRARAGKAARNWFGIEADDLAQETLIKLHRAVSKPEFEYQGDGKFHSYALRIMHNVAVDANTRYAGGRATMTSLDAIGGGDDDRSYEPVDDRANPLRDERLATLDAAVARLKPREQEVIRLTMGGLKVREIAGKMGLRTNVVSQLKHRAIGQLREVTKFVTE